MDYSRDLEIDRYNLEREARERERQAEHEYMHRRALAQQQSHMQSLSPFRDLGSSGQAMETLKEAKDHTPGIDDPMIVKADEEVSKFNLKIDL